MAKSGVEYLAQHPGWKTPNKRLKSKSANPSKQALADELRNLIDAARLVIERWGNGNLADAVNSLRVDAKHAEVLLGEDKEWPGD